MIIYIFTAIGVITVLMTLYFYIKLNRRRRKGINYYIKRYTLDRVEGVYNSIKKVVSDE